MPHQSIYFSHHRSFLGTLSPHLLDPDILVPLDCDLLVPRLLLLLCVLELSEPSAKLSVYVSKIFRGYQIKTHLRSSQYTPCCNNRCRTHSCSSRSFRPGLASASTAQPDHPARPQHPPDRPSHRSSSLPPPFAGLVAMRRTMCVHHHRCGGALR